MLVFFIDRENDRRTSFVVNLHNDRNKMNIECMEDKYMVMCFFFFFGIFHLRNALNDV